MVSDKSDKYVCIIYDSQYKKSRSFIRYNDPTEKLCNTDVDRLENLPEPVGIPG